MSDPEPEPSRRFSVGSLLFYGAIGIVTLVVGVITLVSGLATGDGRTLGSAGLMLFGGAVLTLVGVVAFLYRRRRSGLEEPDDGLPPS